MNLVVPIAETSIAMTKQYEVFFFVLNNKVHEVHEVSTTREIQPNTLLTNSPVLRSSHTSKRCIPGTMVLQKSHIRHSSHPTLTLTLSLGALPPSKHIQVHRQSPSLLLTRPLRFVVCTDHIIRTLLYHLSTSFRPALELRLQR